MNSIHLYVTWIKCLLVICLYVIYKSGQRNSSWRSLCPFFQKKFKTSYYALLKRTFAVEPLLAGPLSLDLRSLSLLTRGGVSCWVFLEGPRNFSSFYDFSFNYCTLVLEEFPYIISHILVNTTFISLMDNLTSTPTPAQYTNINFPSRPSSKPKKFLYEFCAKLCHVPCSDRRGKNAIFHSSRSRFFLFDITPTHESTNHSLFHIHTNDHHVDTSSYFLKSSAKIPNSKYAISLFLTQFFKLETRIPWRIKKKYFSFHVYVLFY